MAPVIVQSPQSISQLEEPVANFECSATGIPLPTIMWSFNDITNGVVESLDSTSVVFGSRDVTAELHLSDVTDNQFGTYSCVATNMFNSDSAAATLSSREFHCLSPVCVFMMYVSRHTIVCRAAQEAGAPHREYINRKKENAIFTPM